MDALMSYSWPGNIRELCNLVERLVLLTDRADIRLSDLPKNISPTAMQKSGDSHLTTIPYHEAKKHFARNYFMNLLKEYEWNISKSAGNARITRRAVYQKIKTFDLHK